MAGTYFGYAERNASDEINWAKIGKNVTDMLQNESKIREEKKAAIDKSSTEYGETLANAPQGEHQGVNTWALTYADNAQQARLMQDRLLKSGQLKLKDYNIMRQNITDGTTQAFSLIKDYQTEYKDKMERYQKGDSQDLEQYLMAEAEGFANFNDSELYINPTNFTVNVAKKKKQIIDGKEVYAMSKNPNDFTTVNAMRNRITGKFDRLDVAKTLQEGVSVLGKDKDAILKLGTLTRGGSITEIIDITRRKDFGKEANSAVSLFERAEDTYLDSVMAMPTSTSSILTNYVKMDPKTKEAYTFTWDPEQAGGNAILLKNDSSGRPVPEFTDEQKEVAKNALREKFRIMLDKEVDIKATSQAQLQERRAPTAAEMNRADVRATAKNVAQNLVYSLTGNANESAAGTKYLSSSTGLPFIKTKEGYVIKDENGNVQTFKFKADGTTLADPTKFTKSFIGTISRKMGIREDDVINEFGKLLPKGAQINLTTEAKGFEDQAPTPKAKTALAQFGQQVDNVSIPNEELQKVEDGKKVSIHKRSFAQKLNEQFSALGVEVSQSILPYKNEIYVKNQDGKESPNFIINDNDPQKTFNAVKKWIKANPSGKTPKEQEANAKKLVETGAVKSGGTGELDD
jgi:hypothetical protein